MCETGSDVLLLFVKHPVMPGILLGTLCLSFQNRDSFPVKWLVFCWNGRLGDCKRCKQDLKQTVGVCLLWFRFLSLPTNTH